MFPNLRYPDLDGIFIPGKGWVLHPLSYISLLEDLNNVWECDGGFNMNRYLNAQHFLSRNLDWSFMDQG